MHFFLAHFYCSTFCSSCHLFNHSFFFLPLTSLFLSFLFFHVDFFLHVTLSISISRVSAICCAFFVESAVVILFFFLFHYLDFLSSSPFFMLWYNINVEYYILCSGSCIPVPINIPVNHALTGSLIILFKVFPCILSISFIFPFLYIPVLPSHIIFMAWNKLQKVSMAFLGCD